MTNIGQKSNSAEKISRLIEIQTFKTKQYILINRRNMAEILLKRRRTQN
jgi:hypothetical protein